MAKNINSIQQYLDLVIKDGYLLKGLNDEQKNSKEIVLAAVKQNGFALQYASEIMKSDKEIVLTAMQSKTNAIKFASSKFLSDEKFILEVIELDGSILELISEDLKNNKEIVLIACNENGSNLEYASDNLKSDPEVVKVATDQWPDAIKYSKIKTNVDKDDITNVARIEFYVSGDGTEIVCQSLNIDQIKKWKKLYDADEFEANESLKNQVLDTDMVRKKGDFDFWNENDNEFHKEYPVLESCKLHIQYFDGKEKLAKKEFIIEPNDKKINKNITTELDFDDLNEKAYFLAVNESKGTYLKGVRQLDPKEKFSIKDILLNVSRVNNQLYISSIKYKNEILEADSTYDSDGVDFQAEIIWK
jgi:hypothetical protein